MGADEIDFVRIIGPRLTLRGPSNAAPILSHDDISADLGGDGPGASSARRTIAQRSRRTARYHVRDCAQQAQVHLPQDWNAPAGRAGCSFGARCSANANRRYTLFATRTEGIEENLTLHPKWGPPGSERLRESVESCQPGHAEVPFIAMRSQHAVGGPYSMQFGIRTKAHRGPL